MSAEARGRLRTPRQDGERQRAVGLVLSGDRGGPGKHASISIRSSRPGQMKLGGSRKELA